MMEEAKCDWCKEERAIGLHEYRGDLCHYCRKDSMMEDYEDD